MFAKSPSLDPPHSMQCMEIWGGNRSADNGVVMPGLDVWVYARPYDEDERTGDSDRAGGDVHFVSSCGTGRIARLMLADVAGHGTKVAAVASGLRTLMRRYMNYLDQTTFVEALNRAFTDAESGGGRFATSLAMTYFAPTARLDVCNAGHPRPLRYRAHERRWELLEARGGVGTPTDDIKNLPLGILEPTRYEQFGVGLRKGDLILAYTDAVNEARTVDGRMLGEEGLVSMLQELDARTPDALIPTILERLDHFRNHAPADDDVTLLLMRHNGTAVQAPLLRRLAASVRFLGAIARNLVPIGTRQPIPWPEFRAENLLGAFIPKIGKRWSAKDR